MLLDLTIIGLVITLEPLPLTGFIVVLGAERGTRKGMAFILAWLLCLVVVIGAVLLLTGGEPLKSSSAPSTAALVVKTLIGVALILIGVRQRARMGRPRKPATWMTKVEGMSTATAALLGPLLQPWGLVAAGAATVATAEVSTAAQWLWLVFFCLLSSATIIAMELYAAFRPEKSKAALDAIKNWIDTHTDQAIVVLSLGVGLWLTVDSLYLIVTAS